MDEKIGYMIIGGIIALFFKFIYDWYRDTKQIDKSKSDEVYEVIIKMKKRLRVIRDRSKKIARLYKQTPQFFNAQHWKKLNIEDESSIKINSHEEDLIKNTREKEIEIIHLFNSLENTFSLGDKDKNGPRKKQDPTDILKELDSKIQIYIKSIDDSINKGLNKKLKVEK